MFGKLMLVLEIGLKLDRVNVSMDITQYRLESLCNLSKERGSDLFLLFIFLLIYAFHCTT
jgi:hypothetical protein